MHLRGAIARAARAEKEASPPRTRQLQAVGRVLKAEL